MGNSASSDLHLGETGSLLLHHHSRPASAYRGRSCHSGGTFLLLLAAVLFGKLHTVSAAEIILTPVADTTLIEVRPTNNMGGQLFFNAGTTMLGTRNHGLVKFNPAAQIPAGSRIRGAYLLLEDVKDPTDEPNNALFQLHRLLRPWGEGNKTNVAQPGRGQPASTNEATWRDAFAYANKPWSVAGAGPTNDYAPEVSSQEFIYLTDSSPFAFASTPQTVADVQLWLNQPGTNFGWLLKPADESIISTARRFGAREDTNHEPWLVVNYVPPPLLSVRKTGANRVELSFYAEDNQAYEVQFANLTTNIIQWQNFTNTAAGLGENVVVNLITDVDVRIFRVLAP